MPDHLTVTVSEDELGEHLVIESDIEATTLGIVCEMLGLLIAEAKRLHDEAHYLERSKN